MRDNLIGYLLGVLDPAEAEQLESRLKQDKRLQEQLHLAGKSLWPLKLDVGDFEPPQGLASRTCRCVANLSRPTRAPVEYAASPRGWALADLVVVAGIFFAASLLFFPAIVNSRYHARLAACQNNLRQIGQALVQYSDRSQGYFPQVPAHGNLAAAGMYAPTLWDAKLVDDERLFLCPASVQDFATFRVPSLRELEDARGNVLLMMQQKMGGSFGYTLGYLHQGQLCAVKNLGRTHFALMSDAPRQDGILCRSSDNHGRGGQNVLYEDTNVRFVSGNCTQNLFINDEGQVSAGLNSEDAVIGPSPTPPLCTSLPGSGLRDHP